VKTCTDTKYADSCFAVNAVGLKIMNASDQGWAIYSVFIYL